MPRTVEEIVTFKLNSLKGKVHQAQQCVVKLQENLERLPTNINSLNIALDNMLMSFDEFVTHFDEVCPGLNETVQSPMKASKEVTSYCLSSEVSSKDTDNTDILSRIDKLEEGLSAMRTTIHGDGDGEGSPHRGILSHLSVLENSFNEGTQKLISMEQKVQDVDSIGQKVKDMGVKYASVVDEMRAKSVKENQQKEMDNIVTTNQLQNLEEKLQKMVIRNDSHEQRLIFLESMKPGSGPMFKDQEKKLENIAEERFQTLLVYMKQELKTVKAAIEIKDDPKKELETKSLIEKIKNLEKKFQTTVSNTDACKNKLKRLEDQLKSVKSSGGAQKDASGAQRDVCGAQRDARWDKEINELKLQVYVLDSLTKNQLLQRLSVLENRPVVAFSVRVRHNGPWTNGTVIQDVEKIVFNVGNAFQRDECRFLAPMNGIYSFVLYLFVNDSTESGVKLEIFDISKHEWQTTVCAVTTQGRVNDGGNCDVSLIQLRKGQAVKARVFSGEAFESCTIYGWLVSPTG